MSEQEKTQAEMDEEIIERMRLRCAEFDALTADSDAEWSYANGLRIDELGELIGDDDEYVDASLRTIDALTARAEAAEAERDAAREINVAFMRGTDHHRAEIHKIVKALDAKGEKEIGDQLSVICGAMWTTTQVREYPREGLPEEMYWQLRIAAYEALTKLRDIEAERDRLRAALDGVEHMLGAAASIAEEAGWPANDIAFRAKAAAIRAALGGGE